MSATAAPGMRALLRDNSSFRSLWLARFLSFLGDNVGLIALLLYTAGHFGTGLAVALLMIAGDFVPSLLSPVAGAVSDRWDKRTVMVTCELVQGVVIAIVALTLPPLPLLLPLVAVQSCVAAVFQPASRSAVPSLVRDADLERANAAIGFGTNGMDSAGPLIGAALLAWLSVRDLLLVDVATFAVSAVLLLVLPRLSGGPEADPSAGATSETTSTTTARGPRQLLAEAGAGLRYLWQDKVMRVITLAFCAVVLFNGVDDVALVFLARHTLHGSNSTASLVYAGAGLGLLAGFVLIARTARGLAMPLLIVAGYAISSLGNLLTGLSFAIVAALAFQFVRGLGIAAMDVGHNTLIQRLVPADMLGRVFGNVYGAVGAAAGLSYIFGGLLLDATSPRVTLIVAGSGGLAAAGAAAVLLPRALRR
ncbi:MAG TPA: MFS transporter [Streptosporangiaceae bacterium]|nr:MFS transporter [Streptosporangiaceae bacterium]